jgi:hypothetical protein
LGYSPENGSSAKGVAAPEIGGSRVTYGVGAGPIGRGGASSSSLDAAARLACFACSRWYAARMSAIDECWSTACPPSAESSLSLAFGSSTSKAASAMTAGPEAPPVARGILRTPSVDDEAIDRLAMRM